MLGALTSAPSRASTRDRRRADACHAAPVRSPRHRPGEPAEQSVRRSLDAIASRDRSLRSLVHVDEDAAIEHARRLDAEQAAGALPGALRGRTFVVKDNVDVAGQVTACGSRAHHGRPATQDAPVVARLRAAGAVLVGRANMDELAMGASTATSVHGATRNPHDVRRSPGGSSGGCAAAVAAGLVDLAVGTDTGGSIREPASQCGVLGLAPSPGLVPLGGVVPFDPSCDRVGPLAADPGVLAVALAVMSGADVADPPLPGVARRPPGRGAGRAGGPDEPARCPTPSRGHARAPARPRRGRPRRLAARRAAARSRRTST